MKLCMFSPRDLDLERGWPGKIDGERVIQVAAQTLQAFFTGGGTAREHAEYPLADVVFRPPVLRPPSIRVFDGGDFHFGNPAAVFGPEEDVPMPRGVEVVEAVLRPAAIIGALEQIGGFTIMNDWCAPELLGAKAYDFATSLGPIVVTPDEHTPSGVDWEAVVEYASRNTELLPGDVIAADVVERHAMGRGELGELELAGIGVLASRVA